MTQREPAREPALDRLAATARFRWQQLARREARVPESFAAQVDGHAVRFRAGALAAQLPEVRYRARRDGWNAERQAECLGLAWAALVPQRGDAPPPPALAAACVLLEGGVADVAETGARELALSLAALARATGGFPVHLMTANDARAGQAAARLREPLAALGLAAGCLAQAMPAPQRRAAYAAAVVCAAQREIAFDYLRDRLQAGPRARPLQGMLERLSGEARAGEPPLLRGLHCALVEDADLVMLDDALSPLVMSAEADVSADRLLYEQALELARALDAGSDFSLAEAGVHLSAEGSRRLAQLSVLLGAPWAARQQREALVLAALAALHLQQRGRDYEVEQGRVLFPPAPPEADASQAPDPLLPRLVELKEGCELSRRRDLLFRLTVPRYFARYLHVGALCADARGAEQEFWELYSMRTRRAGAPAPRAALHARLFRDAAGRDAALRAAAAAPGALAVRKGAHREALPAARALVLGALPDTRRHLDRMARTSGAQQCELLLALEDEGLAARLGPPAMRLASRLASSRGEVPGWAAGWLARRALRGAEGAVAAQRRDLVAREEQMDDLLAFAGRRE